MKKQSKLFSLVVLGVLLSIILTTGCKKVDLMNNILPSAGNYYIKFKTDGIPQTFTGFPMASITPVSNGITNGLFYAYKNNVGIDEPQISFQLSANGTFHNGSIFQNPKKVEVGSGFTPEIHITYLDSKGEVSNFGYVSMDDTTHLVTPGGNQHYPSDAKLTITEITNQYIKGTFSPTVYLCTNPNRKHVITEGEFFLPHY